MKYTIIALAAIYCPVVIEATTRLLKNLCTSVIDIRRK